MVTESLDGAPVSREVLQDLMNGDMVVMTTERKAGIIGTLHRMGVMTNYLGDATGVTAKVERPILGCLNPLYDLIIEDRSILLWGPPAVGKTTLLREAARVLSDVNGKSVFIVDTYGEICGEGDVPHPSVGSARRVQVHQRELQHRDMMETLQNHRPETVVVDDVQGEEEAAAVFEMRKQGTQVIAALCACSLEDVIGDLALGLLFGRGKSAGRSLVDENRRGVQGSVAWQRSYTPVFDTLVEMRDRNHWILHRDLVSTVDAVWETDTTLCVEERRVVMGSQGGEVIGHEEVIAMTKPFKLYEP
ncbi:uncharacterized protein [Diadema antillarum]|uniref:uncharacterized protein n=1 Tax=Diadema antillarum TaxID=105358 RepID=UPI003A887947